MADKTVCRKCGKELGPTVRFCGMCGTPVTKEPAPKPTSAGERTRAPAVTMQSMKGPAAPVSTPSVAVEVPRTTEPGTSAPALKSTPPSKPA